MIFIAALTGSGIAQLRHQKREKAVSLPKLSINIFDVSKMGVFKCVCVCGGGGGVSRET